MSTSRPTAAEPLANAVPSRNGGPGLLWLLALAQLIVILDISAVNVALPEMGADLGIARSDLSWAVTSYSLTFGSLLLLGGRAADLLGRRRMFLSGLAVFTLASLASALAQSDGVFFGARAGQGVGAALLSPAALSIITTSFHGPALAKALGVWGAVGGAGAAVGVLLGGALTELVDWRGIFLINVPIAVAVAWGTSCIVRADPSRARWKGLDLRGAAVATASLATLVYALSTAADAGWASGQTICLCGGGLAGLLVFAALEVRTPRPLLNVERLGERGVGGGFLLMLPVSAVMFGSFLLSSIYLQEVLGIGALLTGLGFLPIAVAIGAGTHIGSRVINRFGLKVAMTTGLALTAIAMYLLSGMDPDGSYFADVLPGMFISGVGLGLALVSVALAVLTGASHEDAGMLSGLNTTGHEIGGALGVAVLVTVATDALTSGGSETALAAGLGDAFIIAALIATVSGVVALLVLPSASTFLPKLRFAPQAGIH